MSKKSHASVRESRGQKPGGAHRELKISTDQSEYEKLGIRIELTLGPHHIVRGTVADIGSSIESLIRTDVNLDLLPDLKS